MKNTQRIDLGEYIIIIEYDKSNGSLDVTVLDELEDMIDMMSITNDDDNDEIDLNLN